VREKFGTLKGLNYLIIGDIKHSRVAGSDIPLMLKMGAKVKVCGPPTLIPKYIEEMGVTYEPNLKKALEWCDVANVLRIQLERMDIKFIPSLREYSLFYGVNRELLDSINKDITIMHPGPINRGVELNSDVADSKQAIILQQVENGVAIRMAALYLLADRG
jgi:aspartate carbamoyltransferase catalytic subunit